MAEAQELLASYRAVGGWISRGWHVRTAGLKEHSSRTGTINAWTIYKFFN
jgi:hypothetical protein